MTHRLDITARLQHRIIEIASTALTLITKTQAEADLTGLAHLRGEMIDAVSAYVGHVRSLYADGRTSKPELDALRISCTKLNAAYDAFRHRWKYRDGIDHWHEYRLSAAVLMKQIRSYVQARDESSVQAPVRAA